MTDNKIRHVLLEYHYALKEACRLLCERTGACPADLFDWDNCMQDGCIDAEKCWHDYFMEMGAEKSKERCNAKSQV